MENDKGRRVDECEVIEELGINQLEYIKNMKKYKPVAFISLEGSDIYDQDKQENFKQDSLTDVQDERIKTPETTLLRKEFLNKLISKSFSRLEQKIIYYYYYEGLTMGDISNKLNMSESRISQIHTDVMTRLKDKIKRNPDFFGEDITEYMNKYNDNNPLF